MEDGILQFETELESYRAVMPPEVYASQLAALHSMDKELALLIARL